MIQVQYVFVKIMVLYLVQIVIFIIGAQKKMLHAIQIISPQLFGQNYMQGNRNYVGPDDDYWYEQNKKGHLFFCFNEFFYSLKLIFLIYIFSFLIHFLFFIE